MKFGQVNRQKRRKKTSSPPVKYNNQLNDGDRREKAPKNKYILLKKESEEGLRRGLLGCDTTRDNFFLTSRVIRNRVERCTENGIVCVGCTMRFQEVHRVRPKSGWLLSYDLKGVSAAIVAGWLDY